MVTRAHVPRQVPARAEQADLVATYSTVGDGGVCSCAVMRRAGAANSWAIIIFRHADLARAAEHLFAPSASSAGHPPYDPRGVLYGSAHGGWRATQPSPCCCVGRPGSRPTCRWSVVGRGRASLSADVDICHSEPLRISKKRRASTNIFSDRRQVIQPAIVHDKLVWEAGAAAGGDLSDFESLFESHLCPGPPRAFTRA
jgi:hypothetical protein